MRRHVEDQTLGRMGRHVEGQTLGRMGRHVEDQTLGRMGRHIEDQTLGRMGRHVEDQTPGRMGWHIEDQTPGRMGWRGLSGGEEGNTTEKSEWDIFHNSHGLSLFRCFCSIFSRNCAINSDFAQRTPAHFSGGQDHPGSLSAIGFGDLRAACQ
jgi:hypothetical protein